MPVTVTTAVLFIFDMDEMYSFKWTWLHWKSTPWAKIPKWLLHLEQDSHHHLVCHCPTKKIQLCLKSVTLESSIFSLNPESILSFLMIWHFYVEVKDSISGSLTACKILIKISPVSIASMYASITYIQQERKCLILDKMVSLIFLKIFADSEEKKIWMELQ